MTADEPMRSTSGILSEFMGIGGASTAMAGHSME